MDWRIYQDMADNFNDNPLAGFRQYRAAHAAGGDARCASAPCRPARCKTWHATSPPAACPRSRGSSRPPPTPSIPKSRRRAPAAPTRNGCWTSSRAIRRSGAAASSSSPTTRTTASTTTCRRRPARAQRRRAIGRPVHRGAGRRIPRRAHRPQRRHARRPAALHGRAFGMGPRVPMLVVSPWSRGGWVNAQVFDHTSVIRFLKPAMASWNLISAPGAAPSPAT